MKIFKSIKKFKKIIIYNILVFYKNNLELNISFNSDHS